MKFKAFAKINLRLNVLGKNEINYHNLFMLNAKVSLYDEIDINEKKTNSVEYSVPELNTLENDLCLNLLNEMTEKYELKKRYYIYIKKNIPMGAGLGGGSSDVACIINALDEMHNLNLTLEEKISIGLKYGADVPYCLINDLAVVEGIGEKITKLNVPFKEKVVIIYPNIFTSTKKVFEKVKHYSAQLDIETLTTYIYNKDYNNLLINDLESPSFELNNKLFEIKNNLSKICPVVMSGSGSSLLAFIRSDDDYKKIKDLYPEYNLFYCEII